MLSDTLLPGFGLRISKRVSTYVVVTRDRSGSQIRRRLGTTKDTTPTQARERARRAIEDAQAGTGLGRKGATRAQPVPAGALPAAAQAKPYSFKWVADAYLADGLRGGGAKLKTNSELARKVTKDLAEWHDRAIGSITSRDIAELMTRKAEISPVAANRLTAFVRKLFRWAKRRHMIDANPAADIEMPADETSRDRYLTDNEIRLIWKACGPLGDPIGRLFRVALATAQRRGEVGGLKRSEIGVLEHLDRATSKTVRTEAWLLPPERTKRLKAHAVPLSPLVKRLLEGAPNIEEGGKVHDHVFATGRRGDAPPNGWSRFKQSLDDQVGLLIAEEAGEEYDSKVHRLPEWHVHDLRRTAATHMEMLGVDRRVISRVLNHAEGDAGMTAVYARYRFDAEAAAALNLWAEKLERLTGRNGVPLRDEAG